MTNSTQFDSKHRFGRRCAATIGALIFLAGTSADSSAAEDADNLSRHVRRILSDNCFKCHGPDPNERKGGKGGLRLDTADGAQADLGGYRAIVPGDPANSALLERITTTDPDDKMPPPDSGKKLAPEEIEAVRTWIEQGASYVQHWSYAPPVRPDLPPVSDPSWPRNAIDYFILAGLDREELKPSPQADPHSIVRRVTLDLTGLPPTLEEVDRFVADTDPGAYDKLVDRLLARTAFGEHWARQWLDLARYADSSGYADDPPRTIWGYRDHVIRALNANQPFDDFTIEQIAGDLLPDPTDSQLIATAFHRNTQTNNEGGTSDEEFRNVAVVDRVNTTMSVWMGTTMGCAQCHDHKYDPISQEDYFRLFAIFNNTADADRRDESPVLEVFTAEQKRRRERWQQDVERLEKTLRTPTPALASAQADWEPIFATDVEWQTLEPETRKSRANAPMTQSDDGVVEVGRGGKTDVYTLEIPVASTETITALRLETLPDNKPPGAGVGHAGGNFVVSRIDASIIPPDAAPPSARYVRIEIPGENKILSLAEVQVFRGEDNIAIEGEASQSSTSHGGDAKLAIDGNTDGAFAEAKSTTHTEQSTDPWWELDLKGEQVVDRVVLWNRTDKDTMDRLTQFHLTLLNEQHEAVWQKTVTDAPDPSAEFIPITAHPVTFASAHADHSGDGFAAANVLNSNKDSGWSISPQFGTPHVLTLPIADPLEPVTGSTLVFRIEQLSKFEHATVARFRISTTSDARAGEFARTPPEILAIIRTEKDERSPDQSDELERYYLSIAPALAEERRLLAETKSNLDKLKPYTTVSILKELEEDKRRSTHIQRRGNFLDLDREVVEGLPAAFQPASESEEALPDRMTLAKWLVDTENPLTARVAANRFWEALFGTGLVPTSEEFGAQGEFPSHPRLLDWLATEWMASGWDTKHMIRLIVTSATYRQSSRVTPELLERDSANRYLARGPRFRLTAEMIRDQALFVAGLLSPKMYGPPVKPPQPQMGLSAAFGSGIDWQTSKGEDRYRRALYTTWRRSNPYPSMSTFDAPNREVCIVRRERSNTPLQALVTLNDPVFLEAAQGLASRLMTAGPDPGAMAAHGFRLCLARSPSEAELAEILHLYTEAHQIFADDNEKARQVALGGDETALDETEVAELAAWTVVGNMLLNLDEIFMKR